VVAVDQHPAPEHNCAASRGCTRDLSVPPINGQNHQEKSKQIKTSVYLKPTGKMGRSTKLIEDELPRLFHLPLNVLTVQRACWTFSLPGEHRFLCPPGSPGTRQGETRPSLSVVAIYG